MNALLLTPAEAGQIFGTRPLGGRDGRSDQVYTRMVPARAVIDDHCNLGTPALAENHQGSGWQAVRRQYLTTQNSETDIEARSLVQAVVSFPDANAAQQFVKDSRDAWQRCANRSINLKRVTDTSVSSDYWSTGEVSEADGGVRLTWTKEGSNGWSCHDSMTPRNNVVVELEICGASPAQPVDEVLAQITDNIEAAQ